MNIFIVLLGFFMLSSAAQAVTGPAEVFIESLEQGRFELAHALFTEEVAAALPAEQLGQIWQNLPVQLGEYQGRGVARIERIEDRSMTVYRLEFESMALDARISLRADGGIDGFRLIPVAAQPEPISVTTSVRWTDHEVTVAHDLPGLLTVPMGDGPFPGVLLVHGSGPNDRDETIGPNKPFRDLAHGLAERGIATLRYDKRTLIQPERFQGRAFTVEDEVLADTRVAFALLREQTQIDPARVYLIGHSLGAMLAPRIAGQLEPAAAGLVLLAPPARSLQTLVVDQVEYIASLDGTVDVAETAQLKQLHAAAVAADDARDSDSAAPGLLGLPESYLADLNAYDPVETALTLDLPMLIIQGGRDYQVTVAADFARWRQAFDADPAAELVLYPDLDHLFRTGQGMATPASYLQRIAPFDERVIDVIADFVAGVR